MEIQEEKRKEQKTTRKKNQTINKIAISIYPSMIILNVSGLND